MIEIKFLKEIIEKPITGEWGNDGGNVKVIRTTNFTNEGRLNLTKVVKREIEEKKVKTKQLRKGDIIIEKSGGSPKQPVGRVVYFEEDDLYLCNNFTAVLRPKKEMVLPKYLHYILFCNHLYGFTNYFQNKTTGIINLQLPKYIERSKIPLPPLPQQKKIAAILDAADAYRQKTKALIAKYDELTQSLFLDMFGDPVTNPKGWGKSSIGGHINIKHGFAFKSEYFVDISDYILLTPGNYFEQGGYKHQGIKQKYYEGEIPEGYILKEGAILVAMTEQAAGLLGSTLFVPAKGTFLHNQRLGLFEYKKEIDPVFIYTVFNQSSFRKRVHMEATGTKVRHTSPSKLMNIEIGFPPLALQNQFSQRIQQIEAQKAQAQLSLVKAEELFNSLLQRAFTSADRQDKGELV
jgi:type I restriction enzyme S subunit